MKRTHRVRWKAELAAHPVRYTPQKVPMPEKNCADGASSAQNDAAALRQLLLFGGVWGKTFHTTAFSAFLSHIWYH